MISQYNVLNLGRRLAWQFGYTQHRHNLSNGFKKSDHCKAFLIHYTQHFWSDFSCPSGHISYHIISYHIISYHIISYHIISYHIISYHIKFGISYYQAIQWWTQLSLDVSPPDLLFAFEFLVKSHKDSSYILRSILTYYT